MRTFQIICGIAAVGLLLWGIIYFAFFYKTEYGSVIGAPFVFILILILGAIALKGSTGLIPRVLWFIIRLVASASALSLIIGSIIDNIILDNAPAIMQLVDSYFQTALVVYFTVVLGLPIVIAIIWDRHDQAKINKRAT